MTTRPEPTRAHALGDLLRRTALRHADKLAVVDGDRRVTFAGFDAAVNRAAHALSERGLAKVWSDCWKFRSSEGY